MNGGDKPGDERWSHLERLAEEYRATRKRQLLEYARKVWLRMERCSRRARRADSSLKIH
jgi:hypothetical protein